MLAEAAESSPTRQASKKKPRTFGDYREMLKQKDLDIVLIATPDHWHALPMIAAVQGRGRRLGAEADQRGRRRGPGDARRGAQVQARRAGRHAAAQHAAPDRGARRFIKEGKLGKIGAGRDLLLLPHARRASNPPDRRAAGEPRLRDVDRSGARCGRTIRWSHPRQLAGVHGVRQRHRRRHVHPHARHGALDAGLGWPKRISSTGGILVDKGSKANITDTQTATFDYGDLQVVWQHRTWGHPPDPKYPWGATFYGDKGTLKASVMSYDFIPDGRGAAGPQGRDLRVRAVSRRTRPRRTSSGTSRRPSAGT